MKATLKGLVGKQMRLPTMEDLAHVPASAVRRPSHEDTITEAHFILDGAFDVLRAARRGNQPEFVSELGRLICQAERLIRMRKE